MTRHIYTLMLYATTLLMTPLAWADFTPHTIFTMPDYAFHGHYAFAQKGAVILDVGLKNPTRVFHLADTSKFFLILGQTDKPYLSIFERPASQELFYWGIQAQDDSDYASVRMYFKDYVVSATGVTNPMTMNLRNGYSYSDFPYAYGASLDGNRAYFNSNDDTVIYGLNIDTHTAGPAIDTSLEITKGDIQSLAELDLAGARTLLAVSSSSSTGNVSSLHYYDVTLRKAGLQIHPPDLGLMGAVSDSVRPVVISPLGDKMLICQKDKCLVLQMGTKNILATLAIDGTTNSDAIFSSDSRYLFYTDYNSRSPLFSVIDTNTGFVVSNKVAVGSGASSRTVLTDDQKVFIVHHGNMIFFVSALNGSILGSMTHPQADGFYDDFVYLSQSGGVIQMRTVDNSGIIQDWSVTL